MNRGQEIRGRGSITYTVISCKGFYSLLSYESAEGSKFIVVWPVIPARDGLFSWPCARDFGGDLHRAARFLDERHAARKEARI